MGAIDGKDVAFIASLIRNEAPRSVVEIGCASGLSTAIMAALLEQQGEETSLTSFDLNEHFYADPSKPVGYFLEEALPHPHVAVTLKTGCIALDVAEHVTGPVDFAFVDASHKHPHPLIDTLALLPLMKPGGVIGHHDLQMFRGTKGFATGPKVLFDQVPQEQLLQPADLEDLAGSEHLRARPHVHNNIYALRVSEDFQKLGEALADGFLLGWDPVGPKKRLSEEFVRRFVEFLDQHYNSTVARAFEEGARRYRGSHKPPAQEAAKASPEPSRTASLERRLRRRLGGLMGR